MELLEERLHWKPIFYMDLKVGLRSISSRACTLFTPLSDKCPGNLMIAGTKKFVGQLNGS